jgi:hypothetical protein
MARISNLDKGADEEREDVYIPNNKWCCSEKHVQFVNVYPLSPTPCPFSDLK